MWLWAKQCSCVPLPAVVANCRKAHTPAHQHSTAQQHNSPQLHSQQCRICRADQKSQYSYSSPIYNWLSSTLFRTRDIGFCDHIAHNIFGPPRVRLPVHYSEPLHTKCCIETVHHKNSKYSSLFAFPSFVIPVLRFALSPLLYRVIEYKRGEAYERHSTPVHSYKVWSQRWEHWCHPFRYSESQCSTHWSTASLWAQFCARLSTLTIDH